MSKVSNNCYSVYRITNYAGTTEQFIKNNKLSYKDISDLVDDLEDDQGFHIRIEKNNQYVFFGDLDKYDKDITEFIELLKQFLKENYDIYIKYKDVKYTQNINKTNSYHYTIPKLNASVDKLKEIHKKLLELYNSQLTYVDANNTKRNCVDTTIYSNHWFRYPNQKKGVDDKGVHKIIYGKMKNFVLDYISKKSTNINDKEFIETINKKKNKIIKNKNINDDHDIVIYDKTTINKDKVLASAMSQPVIYKKVFDECYKQERFDAYESWISVGMAIKNTFDDDQQGFDLFNYFSKKGNNYDGEEKIRYKFQTFIKKKDVNKYTVATIYYYAIEDNKPKFIEIMNKNSFDLEQFDMCKYVKLLAGKIFIYTNDKLYCHYNGKWECDTTIFKKFLSCELYDFLKTILIELYFEHQGFNKMKSQIKRLKSNEFKEGVVKMYKEVNQNNNIKFDDKQYLFGFTNIVYDLEKDEFRDYKYDDYIVTNTGYDWREPTTDELQLMNKLINEIMPIPEEKELYLQILATALDGRCLEKFIIFNGCGGNGKGLINDILLLALGNYGLIGNNSILFETNKTGSNPEKANIHKKRLVIFREPSERHKFENATIKELTGGGYFSARTHHETTTQKELNLTMIVECNKKPLFVEEPTNADVRRIIDIYFRSIFVSDKNLVDISKHIYLAETSYKEKLFQEKHKFALIKILMNTYKRYRMNNYVLVIPQSIIDRTQSYLELSCHLLSWFKDKYELTNNNKDICKIKDIYSNLTNSIYFSNLSKFEKKKYTKAYLTDYISNNIFLKKYYIEKGQYIRNSIIMWKLKNNNDDELSNNSDTD